MRYLIATDGSEQSLKAARFFVQQTKPDADDEVFVVYVFPLPPDPDCYDGVVALPGDAADPRVTEVAQPILARTRDALASTPSTVHEGVLLGMPARELVRFAMNLDIDQIVVGTHGHSADDGVYLGSVSGALAQRAPCPVLLVR